VHSSWKNAGRHFVAYVERYLAASGSPLQLTSLGRNLRHFLNYIDNLHEYVRPAFPAMRAPSFYCETVSGGNGRPGGLCCSTIAANGLASCHTLSGRYVKWPGGITEQMSLSTLSARSLQQQQQQQYQVPPPLLQRRLRRARASRRNRWPTTRRTKANNSATRRGK
jgi:hypothetical protein